MDANILAIYCRCADLWNAMGHVEDPQQPMSEAEVITTGGVAMGYCRGQDESARALLSAPRYLPHLLSRSRVNRRWLRLNALPWTLFALGGQRWKELNTESLYSIASFPVAGCDNDRIPRAKLSQHEQDRGPSASKKRYLYGRTGHLMVTTDGQPVECLLTPGAYSDVRALTSCQFNVPEGSWISAERADHDDAMEDVLREAAHVQRCPLRKQRSIRMLPPYIAYVPHDYRNMMETAGSLLERMRPNTSQAVTAAGVALNVFLVVLAYRINCW